MHGVQTWVALPKAHEETAPAFEHVEKGELPAWTEGGAALRLIVGTYGGRTAPTTHFSPIFYVAAGDAGGSHMRDLARACRARGLRCRGQARRSATAS